MMSGATAVDPAYRKLQRAALALCAVLAPLSLVAWFSVCPPFGDVSCPSQGMATIAAFRAMNSLLHQVFTALNIAWLITASSLLMGPIAYGTRLGALQIAGYGLVLAGSIAAAMAILGWRIHPAAPAAGAPDRAARA